MHSYKGSAFTTEVPQIHKNALLRIIHSRKWEIDHGLQDYGTFLGNTMSN